MSYPPNIPQYEYDINYSEYGEASEIAQTVVSYYPYQWEDLTPILDENNQVIGWNKVWKYMTVLPVFETSPIYPKPIWVSKIEAVSDKEYAEILYAYVLRRIHKRYNVFFQDKFNVFLIPNEIEMETEQTKTQCVNNGFTVYDRGDGLEEYAIFG